MEEQEILKKYDAYIAKHALNYLNKTNQPDHLFEDMKSEATLAFLETIRKYQIEQENLSPLELTLVHNAMRSALRGFVWSYNGMKNKNRPMEINTTTFSDYMDDDSDPDDSRLNFLGEDDDYSSIDVKDALDSLTKVERKTADMLMMRYSPLEVAKMRNVSPASLSKTIKKIRTKLLGFA